MDFSKFGSSRIKFLLASALAFILLICPGCHKKVKRPEEKPNIFILIIDALRPDSLADYGYSRNTNPFLSGFGEKGTRFKRAYAHSSHTRLSVASLFTSLLPPMHQVRKAAKPGMEDENNILSDVLSPELVTIAEVLKEEGYTTAAFHTNPNIRDFMGFDQGFDLYQEYPGKTPADTLNKKVIKWLNTSPKKPVFLYLHYMDVHSPYKPPRDYKYLYTNRRDMVPVGKYGPWDGPMSKELVDYTRAVYDAQINYWDDAFKRFIKALDSGGWLDHTLVVIISDHGEQCYEHGGFLHSYTVYREEIQVPMYMVLDGYIPKDHVYEKPAQLIDIFPTLCYFAGADVEKLFLQGRNVFSGHEDDPLIYAETYRGRAPRCVQNSEFKLIKTHPMEMATFTSTNKNPDEYEFYDRVRDPREMRDIYRGNRREVKELKKALEAIEKLRLEGVKGKSIVLDPETVEQLKSLGYIE